jgi:hypothetical protein
MPAVNYAVFRTVSPTGGNNTENTQIHVDGSAFTLLALIQVGMVPGEVRQQCKAQLLHTVATVPKRGTAPCRNALQRYLVL